MKKFFTYSAAMMVALSAVAADDIKVTEGDVNMMVETISPNGKFAVGGGSVWDVEAGKVITTEVSEKVSLMAVSNSGIAVGNDAGEYAVKMNANGDLEYFDGTQLNQYSSANGISADGTIIVGCRFDSNYFGEACYWENGTYHVLPHPDVYEDLPDDIGLQYSVANGISADGSVIIGNLTTGLGADAFVMWTRNADGNYEYSPLYLGIQELGYELEKPYMFIRAEGLSEDGQWIALTLQKNSMEDMTYYIGRYNIKNGEVELGEPMESEPGDYHGCGIANNGTTVGYIEQAEMTMYGRKGIIWGAEADAPVLLSSYCNNNADVAALESKDAMVASGISSDAQYVGGFTVSGANTLPFMITLPTGENGVNTIAAELDGSKAVYDLQGRRVYGQPSAGLYIIVENNKSQKVIVK